MHSIEDRAYMAGMIDGEGCIAVTRRMVPKGKNWSYRATLIIANKHRGMLEHLQRVWSGQIHTNKAGCHNLHFAAKDTERVLTECFPYLIVKRKQALIMFDFLATFERTASDDTFMKRSELYAQLKAAHGDYS